MKTMKTLALILAGGIGKRTDLDKPKQFMKIGSEEIFEIALRNFIGSEFIDSIFIVVRKDNIDHVKNIIKKRKMVKVEKVIPGGETRQLSARNGILAADKTFQNILIHDAARPFVSKNLIEKIIKKIEKENAVIPVLDVSDTLIKIDKKNYIEKTLIRKDIKRVQTPQGFKNELIFKAHKIAFENKEFSSPDDSSLVIKYGLARVATVRGELTNIKITYKDDLEIAKNIFNKEL